MVNPTNYNFLSVSSDELCRHVILFNRLIFLCDVRVYKKPSGSSDKSLETTQNAGWLPSFNLIQEAEIGPLLDIVFVGDWKKIPATKVKNKVVKTKL